MAQIQGGTSGNGGKNGGNGGKGGGSTPPAVRPHSVSVAVPTGDTISIDYSINAPDLTTPITLSTSSLPIGVTASFSPASVLLSNTGVFRLYLTATDDAPVSVGQRVSVVATGQNLATVGAQITVSVKLQLTLDVQPGRDVTQSTSNSVQIGPYQKVTIPVRLNVSPGFGATPPISLSVKTPLPTGVVARFDPATFTPPTGRDSLFANLLLSTPPPANVTAGTTKVTVAVNVGPDERNNYTFPLVVVMAQLEWFTCTVNQVGPAADGAGAETSIPVIYINLSDSAGRFSSFWFFAADVSRREMLAVALAAINAGRTVNVCLQAPNPGNDPYTPCYRLYLNAS